jgi:membrane protease YdiL (CAAX protease family)
LKRGGFALSDVTGDIESRENEQPKKLLVLAVLFASIAAVVVPLLIQQTLYTAEGISENPLLTAVALPAIHLIAMLIIVLLVTRTRIAGDLDFVWCRWTRSELIKACVLILAVPVVYFAFGLLIVKLGLPLKGDLWFWAGQKGLAFFVSLTILRAIAAPILEEVFWRGYVQGTLARLVGGFAAWLGQAVLFGAFHLMPLGRFVRVFFYGLITGAWRWRRRTLLPIIIAHVAVNSLCCAVKWPDWLDCTRVKVTTDYLAQYKEIVGIDELDPNDNARDFYENARQLAVKQPAEWAKANDVWPAHWLPNHRTAISSWLSASEQALEYVEKGSEKPYYWPEIRGDITFAAMPDIAWVRDAVFALCARSQLYAADGELEHAFSDLTTCFRFGAHFTGRQVLVAQLVGISTRTLAVKGAFRVLANTQVEPVTLADFQTRFEQLRADGMYSLDFTAERLVFHDSIQRMFTDDGTGDGYIPEIALRIPGSLKALVRGFSERQTRDLLKLNRRRTTILTDELFDRLAEATKMTAWQFQNDANHVRTDIERIIKRNAYIAYLAPNCVKVLGIASRMQTDLEALIATVSILRYEAERGQLPSSLETLVDEGYLKALPQDNYSDGPLVYKRTDDAFVLYSLGADFDDDGGTPSRWGEGKKGGDQIFWPVERPSEYTGVIDEDRAQ